MEQVSYIQIVSLLAFASAKLGLSNLSVVLITYNFFSENGRCKGYCIILFIMTSVVDYLTILGIATK